LIFADQDILIEISNGYVCFAVRAVLVTSVKELLARAQQGADPLDRLIIETQVFVEPREKRIFGIHTAMMAESTHLSGGIELMHMIAKEQKKDNGARPTPAEQFYSLGE
jgi:G3E family GTPase